MDIEVLEGKILPPMNLLLCNSSLLDMQMFLKLGCRCNLLVEEVP